MDTALDKVLTNGLAIALDNDLFASPLEQMLGLGCGIALLGLLGLGLGWWRSQRLAQAAQTQLQAELEQLRRRSAAIQSELEQKLQTSTTAWQSTQREKAELETHLEAVKQQCTRLRTELDTQANQVSGDAQFNAFAQIQTLLTQYPSMRCMAEAKPELPARNLVALLSALDNLVQFWGYEPIGEAWQSVPFAPQYHEGDAADLQPGDPVYIRFVGYRQGDRILTPAKVSRTLPAGISRP